LNSNPSGTFTKSYDLSNLPSNTTAWSWKGKLEDNNGNKFEAKENITVN
jgi:hypothetical protein